MDATLQEIIIRGRARYHSVNCGFGSSALFPLTSGIEINFRETSQGQQRRGNTSLAAQYSVQQTIVGEALFERVNSIWSAVFVQRDAQPDTPDSSLVIYVPAQNIISTLDTPGFTFTPGVRGVPQNQQTAVSYGASAVSLQQNFNTCLINGNNAVSPVIMWHHFLLLERSPNQPWVINRQRSSIGRGHRRNTNNP